MNIDVFPLIKNCSQKGATGPTGARGKKGSKGESGSDSRWVDFSDNDTYIPSTGLVGIGMEPTGPERLQVDGNVNITGSITANTLSVGGIMSATIINSGTVLSTLSQSKQFINKISPTSNPQWNALIMQQIEPALININSGDTRLLTQSEILSGIILVNPDTWVSPASAILELPSFTSITTGNLFTDNDSVDFYICTVITGGKFVLGAANSFSVTPTDGTVIQPMGLGSFIMNGLYGQCYMHIRLVIDVTNSQYNAYRIG